MGFKEFINEAVPVKSKDEVTSGFHGSPNKITKFNTLEVCLAKNINEAKRYGKIIHIVEFKDYIFETKSIYVLNNEHVLSIKLYKG